MKSPVAAIRACAERLDASFETVSYLLGIIHDVVMLNALASTTAARGAIALATSWLSSGVASINPSK